MSRNLLRIFNSRTEYETIKDEIDEDTLLLINDENTIVYGKKIELINFYLKLGIGGKLGTVTFQSEKNMHLIDWVNSSYCKDDNISIYSPIDGRYIIKYRGDGYCVENDITLSYDELYLVEGSTFDLAGPSIC